jgi:hypothetical protein
MQTTRGEEVQLLLILDLGTRLEWATSRPGRALPPRRQREILFERWCGYIVKFDTEICYKFSHVFYYKIIFVLSSKTLVVPVFEDFTYNFQRVELYNGNDKEQYGLVTDLYKNCNTVDLVSNTYRGN